jgi:hypothetical protein
MQGGASQNYAQLSFVQRIATQMTTQQLYCIDLKGLFASVLFMRNGFTAYSALSPAIGLSCHRR